MSAVVVDVDAVGVGIAGGVEPIAAAVLAPSRAGQQPVHQLFVGIRRRIVDEPLNLFHRRRQTGQIKADTPDQRSLARLACRLQPLVFQFGAGRTCRLDPPHQPVCVTTGSADLMGAGYAQCSFQSAPSSIHLRSVSICWG